MCRRSLIKTSIPLGITIFLMVQCSSIAQGNPQYIVNRIDFDDFGALLFDFDSGTPYKDCGGSNSVIRSVALTPCDEISEGHCVLRRGTNVTCNLSFESEENSSSLTAKVFGIIEIVPIPLPCPQPTACKNSGIVCPLVKGQLYNYSISAPILESYPRKKLWVKGELKDDSGNMVTCIEIPIKIE